MKLLPIIPESSVEESIGICPVEFYRRYEEWPPFEMIQKIIEEFKEHMEEAKKMALQFGFEPPKWEIDLINNRLKLKLRVEMMETGKFWPALGQDDDHGRGSTPNFIGSQ